MVSHCVKQSNEMQYCRVSTSRLTSTRRRAVSLLAGVPSKERQKERKSGREEVRKGKMREEMVLRVG
jgi:hypothetical protein